MTKETNYFMGTRQSEFSIEHYTFSDQKEEVRIEQKSQDAKREGNWLKIWKKQVINLFQILSNRRNSRVCKLTP